MEARKEYEGARLVSTLPRHVFLFPFPAPAPPTAAMTSELDRLQNFNAATTHLNLTS